MSEFYLKYFWIWFTLHRRTINSGCESEHSIHYDFVQEFAVLNFHLYSKGNDYLEFVLSRKEKQRLMPNITSRSKDHFKELKLVMKAVYFK